MNLRSLLDRFGTSVGRESPVERFLRWWLSELRGLLPAGIRSRLFPAGRHLVLDLDEDSMVEAHIDGTPRGGFKLQDGAGTWTPPGEVRDITLRLPAHHVLERELQLPAAAAENLRQVLAFEMDRATPFRAEQVCYDGEIVERLPEQRQIRVRLVAAPRPLIDGILAALDRHGIQPRKITVKGQQTGRINLLPPERRLRKGARFSRFELALACLAVALFLATILMPLLSQRAQAMAMQAAAAAMEQEAQAVDALRVEADRRETESRFLVERKITSPVAIEVIDELARRLPDDTFLNNLQLSGNTLTVQGESSTASGLIESIEESPLFSATSFRSPVTKNNVTGLERFQITTQVAGGLRP